jgi:protein SCO1/2
MTRDIAATPPRDPARALLGAATAVLLLAACSADTSLQGNLEGSTIGGDFSLVDERGRPVTSASFDGMWRLMYFGFTFCPDVCPVDTANMARGLRAFEGADPDRGARVQPLFVTVDPERDTPEALAEFTDAFHPRLLGLTGTREQVDAALSTFRIYARRAEGGTEDGYLIDHMAVVYLFDPDGRPVHFIAGPEARPEAVAAMLESFVS